MNTRLAVSMALLMLGSSVTASVGQDVTFSVGLGTVEDPPQSQSEFPADTQKVVATAVVGAPVQVSVSGNFVFEFDPETAEDDVTIPIGPYETDPASDNTLHFDIGGMPGGFPSRANRFDLLVNGQTATTMPFTVDIPALPAEELGFGLLLLGTAQEPETSMTTFAADTPEIVLTAVRFMPLGTTVSGTLVFEGGPNDPAGATLTGEDIVFDKPMNVVYLTFSKPDAGWPIGTSRLDVIVNGETSTSLSFTVE